MSEKRIVVPGETVTEERKRLGEHVFAKNGKIFSDVLGIVDETPTTVSVVPLEGVYTPKPHDIVVGVIASETFNGYLIDINSFYLSFSLKERMMREPLRPGNIVSAKIMRVNELNEADLGNLRPLFNGTLLLVSPVKVPRIIGKNASMLEVLKKGTGSSLIVGRNGVIWANGGNLKLLIEAIRKIEKESHLSNLTNSIEEFLKKNK